MRHVCQVANTKEYRRGTGTRGEGLHQTGKVGGREGSLLKESVCHQQQLDPAPQSKNRLGDHHTGHQPTCWVSTGTIFNFSMPSSTP